MNSTGSPEVSETQRRRTDRYHHHYQRILKVQIVGLHDCDAGEAGAGYAEDVGLGNVDHLVDNHSGNHEGYYLIDSY